MTALLLIISLLFQIGQPTPTPIGTPNAPQVTVDPLQSEVESLIGTATAEAGRLDIEADGEQIEIDNRPLFPALNTEQVRTTLGYAKWLLTGSESLFGLFAPLVSAVGGFIFVVLALFVATLLTRFVAVLGRTAYFVAMQIYKLAQLVRG